MDGDAEEDGDGGDVDDDGGGSGQMMRGIEIL